MDARADILGDIMAQMIIAIALACQIHTGALPRLDEQKACQQALAKCVLDKGSFNFEKDLLFCIAEGK